MTNHTNCEHCDNGLNPTKYIRRCRGKYECSECERDVSMALMRLHDIINCIDEPKASKVELCFTWALTLCLVGSFWWCVGVMFL